VHLSRRSFLAAASAAVLGACTSARRAARPVPPHVDNRASGTATTAAGGPAAFVAHGPADSGRVAFTFHGSGDLGLLHDLLAAAGRLRVPVTIFAVGSWLDQHPEVAGAILGGGHELANHTYTHPSLGSVSQAVVTQEITRCRDVLLHQTSTNGRWFRPSGIESQPSAMILAEAGKAGYATCVGFDVDSLDYTDPGAGAVVQKVAAGVQAGSIVSLHLGHSGTVSAFSRILSTLQGRGLRPVLVRDLLA
jgi:peptidoglycan/xylan/chitin deacetylase (PgdA/CDA1 family)